MNNTTSNLELKLADIVEGALRKNDVKFETGEDKTIFHLKYKLGDLLCNVAIICSDFFYVISVDYPNVVKEINFQTALSLINKRNNKIPCGSFEIDPDDRLISFRHGTLINDEYIPCENTIFSNLKYCLSVAKGESDFFKEVM